MKLSDIVRGKISYEVLEDVEITGLTHKANEVKNGDMFFCLNGTQTDGHKFARDAVKNGAKVVVCERVLDDIIGATQIIVPSSRVAMSEFSSNFYGEPQKDLKLIMVTGTNGKTTTTYMLKTILEGEGFKVGVIGTNGSQIGNNKIESNLTTPDPIELFALLKQMKDAGCDYVCMEASAHALALDKLHGLTADVAILTNITQDHLDYFRTMDNYAAAKSKLFMPSAAKVGVFNIDDPRVESLFLKNLIPSISVGIDNSADIIADNITQTNSGQNFSVRIGRRIQNFSLGAIGKFNVSNALGAIAAAILVGVDARDAAKNLEDFKPVDGRFNVYEKNGVNIVIDYAHTPEGVANVLNSISQVAGNGRIITVVGCGGNRDAAKRPLMGKIASDFSDKVIITSDNPRYEKPENIINDICSGITDRRNYEAIVNRSDAIKHALSIAREGDYVAILGKGHENYIEVRGEKIPFSDVEEIEKI